MCGREKWHSVGLGRLQRLSWPPVCGEPAKPRRWKKEKRHRLERGWGEEKEAERRKIQIGFRCFICGRGEAGARRSRSAFRPDAPNSLWGFFTWAHWLNVFVSVWSPHPGFSHFIVLIGSWLPRGGKRALGVFQRDVLMACGLMKSCLSLCCWGSGHPAPFFPLFIPLTPRTLGFNFPWVFTACHCLHSEFRTGMKFGAITSFFLFPLLLLFNFNFTESERVVIVRPDENDSLRVWIGSRGLGGRVHLVFLFSFRSCFTSGGTRWRKTGRLPASAKLRRQRPLLVTVTQQLSRRGKTFLWPNKSDNLLS